MGSKRNASSLYTSNGSNRQSNSNSNNNNNANNNSNSSNNSNGNSSNNTNNIAYQNNEGSNSSSHSLKHNSSKDKISKRSNKKMLSIVFDSINSSGNNDNVPKINFSSFNNSVLRKYRDTYKIKTKTNYTRDELLNAVTKHWNSQELSEKDIITHFIYTVRNHGNILKLPLNAITKAQTKTKITNNNNN